MPGKSIAWWKDCLVKALPGGRIAWLTAFRPGQPPCYLLIGSGTLGALINLAAATPPKPQAQDQAPVIGMAAIVMSLFASAMGSLMATGRIHPRF